MIEGFHQEATNYQQAKNDQTLNFDTWALTETYIFPNQQFQ